MSNDLTITRALSGRTHPWHTTPFKTAWRTAFLPTWTPGVKEQDELDLAWSAQGQPIAAYGRIRGAADGQLHRVPGGAGDSSAPAGRVDVGRQTEGGLGAILLNGLGTCVKKQRGDTETEQMWEAAKWPWQNILGLGNVNSQGTFLYSFFPALFTLNLE